MSRKRKRGDDELSDEPSAPRKPSVIDMAGDSSDEEEEVVEKDAIVDENGEDEEEEVVQEDAIVRENGEEEGVQEDAIVRENGEDADENGEDGERGNNEEEEEGADASGERGNNEEEEEGANASEDDDEDDDEDDEDDEGPPAHILPNTGRLSLAEVQFLFEKWVEPVIGDTVFEKLNMMESAVGLNPVETDFTAATFRTIPDRLGILQTYLQGY